MKYDSLKEQTDEAFVGGKFSEQHFKVVLTSEGKSFIQGFPACPECSAVLAHNLAHSHRRCPCCKTVWSDSDLIEALRNERAIAKKLEEES